LNIPLDKIQSRAEAQTLLTAAIPHPGGMSDSPTGSAASCSSSSFLLFAFLFLFFYSFSFSFSLLLALQNELIFSPILWKRMQKMARGFTGAPIFLYYETKNQKYSVGQLNSIKYASFLSSSLPLVIVVVIVISFSACLQTLDYCDPTSPHLRVTSNSFALLFLFLSRILEIGGIFRQDLVLSRG
jgi:hypothetical protein